MRSGVQEAAELAGAAGVFEFAQGLGLDLADAFAGDRELLAHFLQRVIGVHADAEACPGLLGHRFCPFCLGVGFFEVLG